MTKRLEKWLVNNFISYPEWDTDLQEEARERVVHEYVKLIHAGSADQMLEDLKFEIHMDIKLFQEDEHYEVCQLLKEIEKELG